MRFTTALFAATTLSSLAVTTFSTIKDDRKNADLLSLSYEDGDSYNKAETYDMSPYRVFDKESNALNNIFLSLKSLSRDGKLNMDIFDDNKAIWTLKMSAIAEAAEGKLPGPYNMNKSIAFHRRHFRKFLETSDLRATLRRSTTNSYGIQYVDEIIRLYTDMYKLYSYNGKVNTKLVDVKTKVKTIEKDFATLSKQVKDVKALPKVVEEFYGHTSAEVIASLDEVKGKLGISTA